MFTNRFHLRLLIVASMVSIVSWTVIKEARFDLFAAPKVAKATLDERQAVNSGANLERSRKWLDAIDHYKKSLKQYPDNRELTYGLRRAKIHFGVDRRYSDRSFTTELMTFSESRALGLLEEVLDKVHDYYVDKLNTTYFIAHGTESLFLALNNERFIKYNIPAASPSEIKELRSILRNQYWNKPVSHTSSVRSTVREVCSLAQNKVGLNSQAVILEYLFGGCNSLDDYSSYLSPGKLRDLMNNIEGEFVGLGIEMRAEEEKGLLLVNVLDESPALEGGLEAGDYVISIDNKDCRKLSTDESAGLLTGKSGSKVELSWLRGDEQKEMNGLFTRRAVKVKSIPISFMADKAQGIGYFKMSGFQKSSAAELDETLQKLSRQGMKSVIWDLRGNPGGLLTAAVEVLDRFIEDGVLVSTRGRISDQNWKYTAHRIGTLDIPLVVLVDGNSASASEIVSGCIRDHKRGVLVGRKTYGKWSVQSIFPISSKTGLRLSTAKFYSPKGHWYGKIGVEPDYEVEKEKTKPSRVTESTLRSDEDVLKAVQLLSEDLFTQK